MLLVVAENAIADAIDLKCENIEYIFRSDKVLLKHQLLDSNGDFNNCNNLEYSVRSFCSYCHKVMLIQKVPMPRPGQPRCFLQCRQQQDV